MNNVTLVGRLTKDPELRTISTGNTTCSFTVAVSRQFTNANGERETDFINVVAFQKQAENIKKYCFKGSLVAIDGRIQTRNYDDKDGKRVYVTEVVADRVQFLGAKQSASETNVDTNKDEVSPSDFQDIKPNETNVSDDVFADFGSSIEISDDAIAF